MDLDKLKIGIAITGSFCTIGKVIPQIEKLVADGVDVTPIFSYNVATMDNRFNKADELREKVEKITGKKVLATIQDVEPIGPQKSFDALIIAPCTGNTLAKLNYGITDTSVTMATKATLRNKRPVIIAISTNDGLSGSAKNIGSLMNNKNIFFVPYGQDDHTKKETSLVAKIDMIIPTLMSALEGKQIQPIFQQ